MSRQVLQSHVEEGASRISECWFLLDERGSISARWVWKATLGVVEGTAKFHASNVFRQAGSTRPKACQ